MQRSPRNVQIKRLPDLKQGARRDGPPLKGKESGLCSHFSFGYFRTISILQFDEEYTEKKLWLLEV